MAKPVEPVYYPDDSDDEQGLSEEAAKQRKFEKSAVRPANTSSTQQQPVDLIPLPSKKQELARLKKIRGALKEKLDQRDPYLTIRTNYKRQRRIEDPNRPRGVAQRQDRQRPCHPREDFMARLKPNEQERGEHLWNIFTEQVEELENKDKEIEAAKEEIEKMKKRQAHVPQTRQQAGPDTPNLSVMARIFKKWRPFGPSGSKKPDSKKKTKRTSTPN